MAGINIKIGTISTKFHYPYEGIFGKASPGPEYIIKEITGNGYINLTNAVANHLMELKAYGGIEQRILPSEYTQVEYIDMSANSYLLTDVIPTYDCKVEFDFQPRALPSVTSQFLGGRTETFGGLFFVRTSANVFMVDAFGNSADDRYTSNVSVVKNTRYKFIYDNKVSSVISNGETLFTNTSTGTNANGAAIAINGLNSSGSLTISTTEIYVYSFKVWNGQGVLVANYIPCTYDNAAGFYDTVSETFKAATSGTFTAGPTTTPTPEQPIDIVSNNGVIKFSKNLANMVLPNVVEQYYIDNSGNILSSPVNFYYDTFIPVSPNTAYTLSGSKNFRYASLMEYDINQVFLKRTLIDNANTNAKTWTTRSDTAYIRFGSNPGSNETMTIDVVQSYNFQFERGSVPTPYHEYVEGGIYTDGTVETIEDELGNTATTEMLLKVWNYEDTQEILSGVIKRQIGIKILNGTENRAKTTIQTGNVFEADLLDNSMVNTLLCTHFVSGTPLNNNIVYKSAGSSMLQIRYDAMTTVEDLKAWLSGQYNNGSPVIVLYVKETETTETVTGQTMDIQAGNNTIEITQASIDNLGLYAKYKATA